MATPLGILCILCFFLGHKLTFVKNKQTNKNLPTKQQQSTTIVLEHYPYLVFLILFFGL